MSVRALPTGDKLTYAVLMLVPLLALVRLPWLHSQSPLPKAVILQVLALGLVALWIMRAVLTGKAAFRRSQADIALLAFAFLLIVSSIFSINPAVSFLGGYGRFEGLTTWLSYLAVFFTTTQMVRKREQVLLFITLISSISLLISSTALVQYISAGGGGWRVFGTFDNAAFLGSYLAMTIPLSFILFMSERRQRQALGGLAAAAGLAAIFVSFARAAWLALIVVTIMAAFAGRKTLSIKRLSAGIGLLVLGLALVIALTSLTGDSGRGIAYGGGRLASLADLSSGTTATRLEMWRGTIGLIRSRPWFGWGLETFQERFRGTVKLAAAESVFKKADRPHSHFLYLAFSVGLMGALAYYLGLAQILGGARRRTVALDSEDLLVVIGLIAALIGYLIQAEFLFSAVDVSPTMWLLAGLLAAYGNNEDGSPGFPPERAAVLWPALGLILLLALGALFWAGKTIAADYFFQRGLPGRVSGSAPAIEDLQTAVRLNGRPGVYKLALGQAYFAQGKQARNRDSVDKAMAVYETELAKHPNDEIYYNLGDALAFYGQNWDRTKLDGALSAYGQTVKLRPYFPYAYWEIGYIWLLKDKPRVAIDYYERYIKIGGTEAAAFAELGRAYERIGRYRKARATYEKALKLEPGLSPAVEALKRLQ